MTGRLLLVSPSDVLGSPNARTHHVARHLAARFREISVISRALVAQRMDWSALFRVRTVLRKEGTISWISVNPWGHVRDGLGMHLLGLANPFSTPRGGIRRLLRRILNPLGALLEFAVLPSLAVAYARRVGGQVDLVIAEGPWEGLMGLLLRRLGRAAAVVYDDMDYAPGFLPINGLRRRLIASLEAVAIRRADAVICVGERLARLRAAQGVRRVHVLPNGVDLERFRAAAEMRQAASPRPPTLIYTGYLGAWAGVDLVLEAAALAVRRLPDLRLILLGHGSPLELGALRDGIARRNLERAVEFRGQVPYSELPRHLGEADVGLAMSRPLDVRRYAFPLKVVEYMAAGLPVLTTADTEAADLVERASAGTAVPFDAAAVASAAADLLEDPVRHHRLAENARAFSRAYDWQGLMETYHAVVRETLESRSGPARPGVRGAASAPQPGAAPGVAPPPPALRRE